MLAISSISTLLKLSISLFISSFRSSFSSFISSNSCKSILIILLLDKLFKFSKFIYDDLAKLLLVKFGDIV